jgi:hypothetical protein
MYGALRIPRTLRVVTSCWKAAEAGVRSAIAGVSRGLHEESITERTYELFAQGLLEASKSRKVERAFVQDMESQYSDIDSSVLEGVGHGLIALATLHERQVEKSTGGDLGLIVARPYIERPYGRTLRISRSYRRGLLCQARLKGVDTPWLPFTRNQRKVLPARLAFLCLLLYRYEDEHRTALRPFEWQLCGEVSFTDVVGWLRSDRFPNVVAAERIIDGLGNGTLGTDKQEILETIIAPRQNRYLYIRIDWPDGGGPGSEVQVRSRYQAKELQHAQLLRG